ncbi:hypothetical protein [Deinococcus hopiensis]|nr:hypothetical protein [Deinococcus hopiensis]
MTILMGIVLVYLTITLGNRRDTANVTSSMTGFYAAEGGLNLRAEKVRAKFIDYNRPTGTAPSSTSPCVGSNLGTLDFACDSSLTLGGRTVTTYVLDTTSADPAKNTGVVNSGETYAGLNYQQYSYRVVSEAKVSGQSGVEAKLQMEFQSRLVPIFQFAAFYNNDLEINPSPLMTLNGRVHTNGNLYVSPSTGLTINGRVTTGGIIRRGRKDASRCDGGAVNFSDSATTTKTLRACAGGTTDITSSDITQYNGRVQMSVPRLTVPPLSSLDPNRQNELFSGADVRIVAHLVGGTWVPEVRDANNIIMAAATSRLGDPSCIGAVTIDNVFYDNRERATQRLIEIDQQKMMDCIYRSPAEVFTNSTGASLTLDDTTGNGMAWHFSFDDGNTDTNNYAAKRQTNYGIRVKNATTLGSSNTIAPAVKGLTIVTNQAAYVQGSFNVNNIKPAAIICDSINILSNSWPATDPAAGVKPAASNTEVNAAFMAGTDLTNGSTYNGGLENYPRFHEDWGGKTFRYRGSFVSLDTPSHARGQWGNALYNPPQRDWDYDLRFNDAATLPPLTPRFVYLRQVLFAREY